MSERAEVVVEFPLARVPSRVELAGLVRDSYGECRKLIGPLGRVLGIVSTGYGVVKATGQPTLLVKFAVDAPEAVQAAARN